MRGPTPERAAKRGRAQAEAELGAHRDRPTTRVVRAGGAPPVRTTAGERKKRAERASGVFARVRSRARRPAPGC